MLQTFVSLPLTNYLILVLASMEEVNLLVHCPTNSTRIYAHSSCVMNLYH